MQKSSGILENYYKKEKLMVRFELKSKQWECYNLYGIQMGERILSNQKSSASLKRATQLYRTLKYFNFTMYIVLKCL